jgi:maltose/maltodextrin transport system substrate-binding protein
MDEAVRALEDRRMSRPPSIDVSLRRRRLLGSVPAAMLGVGLGARAAAPDGPLVVWFSVEGAKAMRRAGESFTAATGVDVVVETPDDGPQKFQQAASAGKGPDIYVYAHDRIGEWVAAGLIHAVAPSRRLVDDIDPLAWRGFTWRGRLWGYPMALEAITLIHNKALVPVAPRTWDEVFALEARLRPQGRHAILWDYTNAYFTWPMLAAGGAYSFRQRADGSFDVRDTGVANEGGVRGAALLERLIREGLMPAGSGYPEMEAALAQGRAAMMINGPWSWVNLKRVGMDFGVANIPMLDGHAARPFIGVKGLMINRSTDKRELAVEFIERHVLTLEGLRAIDRAEPIGAPASRAYFAELAADPRIAGIMASARDGIPTPAVPEMGRFWAALKTSLTTLSEGRQDARQAMEAAARRIVA